MIGCHSWGLEADNVERRLAPPAIACVSFLHLLSCGDGSALHAGCVAYGSARMRCIFTVRSWVA